MLFSANHGITDLLSYVVWSMNQVMSNTLAEAVVVIRGKPDPVCLRRGASFLHCRLSVLRCRRSDPQGSGVIRSSHCWSVARTVNVQVLL